MNTTLTRGALISEALTQIGRTDLTSNGRLWLNLFLEKAYKCQDWEWLVKRNSSLSIIEGGPVPADYLNYKTGNLLSNGVVQREITTITGEEYLANKRQGASNGIPQRVYVDQNARLFYYWPVPDGGIYAMDFFYYFMPTLPAITDGSHDGDIPIWHAHPDILIKALQAKGMFFNDDTRYEAEEKAIIEELVTGKMNIGDKRGGNNKLKLGKSFRRRF